ncbi:MAG: hypothetical protein GX205_00190 [Firmicutes bacterium]|mgnify:CR=1 FL=1|nr:hypothetical protein [Bacillota bacterium]
MIVYCGLRNFYIQHLKQDDAFYILTHAGQIWDFSPELKQLGFTRNTPLNTVHHLGHRVEIIEIALNDFYRHTETWLDYSRQYTTDIEVEYPHAWYVRIPSPKIAQYFGEDLVKYAAERGFSVIWGSGISKIVAKLAAHYTAHPNTDVLIPPEKTQDFMKQIPVQHLPLPDSDTLLKLGIVTLEELAKFPVQDLMAHFGTRAKILKQIALGEDPIPFQPQQYLEISWERDFTTEPELLQPAVGPILQSYLEQAGAYLAQKLNTNQKMAGRILLQYEVENQPAAEVWRDLKKPTNDAKTLVRLMKMLLPDDPIINLRITLQNLQPIPVTQLEFFQPKKIKPELSEDILKKIPAQKGISIPRRELVLEMWRELML